MCFDKIPVGINSVNRILSVMCKTAGVKREKSHCLRETCASYPFNQGVDSKFVRDRTGHRSNALLKYEKPDEKVVTNVCAILGPAKCNGNESEANDEAIIKREFNRDKKGSFHFVISTWRVVM